MKLHLVRGTAMAVGPTTEDPRTPDPPEENTEFEGGAGGKTSAVEVDVGELD